MLIRSGACETAEHLPDVEPTILIDAQRPLTGGRRESGCAPPQPAQGRASPGGLALPRLDRLDTATLPIDPGRWDS